MAGRLIGLSFLAAIGFLLLFSITGDVSAVTYKMGYSTRLSCGGVDGDPITAADNSCTAGTEYNLGVTADILSRFSVPLAAPKYSNYRILRTFGTPAGWKLATDKQIPDGAAVGKLVSKSTLALFNGNCTTQLVVTIPMYDCTTANFEGVNDGCPAVGPAETGSACNDSVDGDLDGSVNDGCPKAGATSETGTGVGGQCAPGNAVNDDPTDDGDQAVRWDPLANGRNLLLGAKGNIPSGCTKFPTHVNDATGGVKPRARYFGTTVVTANMTPTQLQFVMFTPDQLSQRPAPEASIKDEMGYVNFVILNNPPIPAPAGDSLDEFCTPLESNTTLWGKTGGQGGLSKDILVVTDVPTDAGNFWTVADTCGDATDNDADTKVDEMCGIQRARNPGAATVGAPETGANCCNAADNDSDTVVDDGCLCGLWKTGTYPDGAYGESYYDVDADGINNVEDECPYTKDSVPPNDPETQAPQGCSVNPAGDWMDAVCDPFPVDCNKDQDGDGWKNQQDYCPLIATFGAHGQDDYDVDGMGDVCDAAKDDDADNAVNDGCATQGTISEAGAWCTGSLDEDNDGIVNDGCGGGSPAAYGTSEAANHCDGAETAGAQCNDALDNDTDGLINDGCAQSGATAETGLQCLNNTDDDTGDADGKVNDGCPAAALDDDADTYVNDGCPANGAAETAGAQCNDGPRTIDGLNVNDQPSGGICIGAADSDGDGFCDATENLNPTGAEVLSLAINTPTNAAGESDANTPAGAATPLCSNGQDDDLDGFTDAADAGCRVPEYKALDYTIVAAANPPAAAPRTCGNWSYYDSTSVNADGGVLPRVDEDGDTTINADDPNCATIANDADQDGVPDTTDNCINAWNPTQIDTDGGCTTGSTTDTAGNCGDACDLDDDGDGVNDTVEWAAGNDAKNVCDPRNFDHVANGLINIADVTTYIAALKVTDRPCSPPVNYNVCR